MRKLIFFGVLLLASTGTILAQSDDGPPRTFPQSTPNPLYPDSQTGNAVRRSEDLNRRSDALRMTENLPPAERDQKRREFRQLIEPMYRESTEKEKAFMAPIDEDLEQYKVLLSQKNTGMIRLVADRGCADNVKVVSAAEYCSFYTMPGAGSGYSFRFGDYRMHHLADIVFRPGRFEALGTMNHGIMVNLGDIPVESVSMDTEGLKYLAKLKPSKSFSQAGDLAQKLTKGIKKDGHNYASILPLKLNNTYVIRTIAYRGTAPRTVGSFAYNELELDERRDMVIAFRVIRLLSGSDATIVFKEISDKKAPELKPDKK